MMPRRPAPHRPRYVHHLLMWLGVVALVLVVVALNIAYYRWLRG